MVDIDQHSPKHNPVHRPRKVVMPDVAGLRLQDARVVLTNAGFAGSHEGPAIAVRYVDAYAPELTVTHQAPTRGQLVEASATIDLHVARQSWARHLPQVFHAGESDGAFLLQFLRIVQHIQDRTDDTIARVPQLLRPLETDPAFLPWLASWLALHVEADWPTVKVRHWLRMAPALFEARGTRRALSEILRLHVGHAPVIEENTWPFEPMRIGVASTIGVSSTVMPPVAMAHCFVVRLPIPDTALTQEEIVRIHRVIQAEKPAHTMYYLAFAEAQAMNAQSPGMTAQD